MANRTSTKSKAGFRTFKPTPTFQKKEEKVRQSILLETKEKLRNDIKKIFKDPQYSDVVLVSHSNEFPVHSFILEARFPEFFNLIQSQPPKSRKVTITEKVTYADLEQWVETLYSEDNIDRTSIEEALTLNKGKSGIYPTDKDVSLSTDLLSLLNETCTGDVEFSVQGKCIMAHKAILAARCDYFSAMFSSSWREESSSSITIPDVSSDVFLATLKFIYGASQDILSFPVSKVLPVADMYGLQDLVDLIVVDLKVTKCHLFHKPCTYCIPQVYDCLKLCEPFYHTHNFQIQCIQWICKNFQKTLECKHFPQLSGKFQSDVQQGILKQLSSSTVAVTWLKCNTLLASLNNLNTSWTQPVVTFCGGDTRRLSERSYRKLSICVRVANHFGFFYRSQQFKSSPRAVSE
ncbi:BTB/POZ domain-containing protein 8-like [Dendronephthya gigantea]|uniref:BTB/POZ domain-containing protein 8-like n=1 Tax=Dendronephthya gigantea TaxID=151771 RepID=UPI00106A7F7C|nr:BTB/POZ domain-containing protein 8-like [Dendronephthya gigantea]